MFVGHYAAGFAAKKVEPGLSLGLLIFSTVALDILFGVFLLAGVENARIAPGATVASPFEFYDYPVSHSALGAAAWAAAGFLVYLLWPSGERVSRKRPALIFAAAIFSHYILDVISHTPDMPLLGNSSAKIGLSLWNSLPATMAVELGLFFIGVFLYLRSAKSTSPVGKYGLVFMVLFLAVLYIGSLFGPPPPNHQLSFNFQR